MRRRIAWIFAGGVGVALLILTLVFGKDLAIRSLEAARGAGPMAIVAVFAVATILLIPFWALAIGTGFLLGGIRGGIVALVGNLVGASLAFLLARTLARRTVQDLMARRPGLKGIGQAGFRLVLLTRLSPFMPSNFLNYAFGAAGVTVKAFMPATLLGMLPTLVFYVHTGTTMSRLTDLDVGAGGKVFIGLGLVATAVATWYTVRVVRRALAK